MLNTFPEGYFTTEYNEYSCIIIMAETQIWKKLHSLQWGSLLPVTTRVQADPSSPCGYKKKLSGTPHMGLWLQGGIFGPRTNKRCSMLELLVILFFKLISFCQIILFKNGLCMAKKKNKMAFFKFPKSPIFIEFFSLNWHICITLWKNAKK